MPAAYLVHDLLPLQLDKLLAAAHNHFHVVSYFLPHLGQTKSLNHSAQRALHLVYQHIIAGPSNASKP